MGDVDNICQHIIDIILAHPHGVEIAEICEDTGLSWQAVTHKLIKIENNYMLLYQVNTRIYKYERLYPDECI